MLYPARWKKITVDQSKVLKIDCSVFFGPPGIGNIPNMQVPAVLMKFILQVTSTSEYFESVRPNRVPLRNMKRKLNLDLISRQPDALRRKLFIFQRNVALRIAMNSTMS